MKKRSYINPQTGMRYMYYDKRGKPITDTLYWAVKFKNLKYKIVKQEHVFFGLFWVSTVWLGLDHQFAIDPFSPPLIFETMVFSKGSRSDLETNRYSTLQQAKKGHEAIVKKWKNPFYVIYMLADDYTFSLRLKIERFFKKIQWNVVLSLFVGLFILFSAIENTVTHHVIFFTYVNYVLAGWNLSAAFYIWLDNKFKV